MSPNLSAGFVQGTNAWWFIFGQARVTDHRLFPAGEPAQKINRLARLEKTPGKHKKSRIRPAASRLAHE
jgi:hypothetical protein